MRGKFACEWYKKGEVLLNRYDETGDSGLLFESYIYLWIALTVAAKEYCACNGKYFDNSNGQKTTDKEEIIHWATNCRQQQILTMLENNEDLIFELCERKGSETNSPIIDHDHEFTKNYYKEFIRYWEGETRFIKPQNIVKTFILILNKVRNNLFHGGKSFSVKSDIELLKITCPLLKNLTKICIDTL
jgi:hypothetical protein